ncbi:MAG TPA: hypothetical protein VF597_01175 [Candidatus Saccharimonadales bacterium]|jgi:hypothetical protein
MPFKRQRNNAANQTDSTATVYEVSTVDGRRSGRITQVSGHEPVIEEVLHIKSFNRNGRLIVTSSHGARYASTFEIHDGRFERHDNLRVVRITTPR